MTPQSVFITGIAGTLGKAFARFLVSQGYDVHGIDSNEWAVAVVRRELPDVDVVLGDITESKTLCLYCIHCAAYKHVDLVEDNVESAITNNVTKLISFLRSMKGSQFLFISSDKAVEPISVYGYTKALGEHLTWQAGGQVARLGNILASNGSVIPLWEEAISNKQPIPITDERMTRYVIEAEDAVAQIWQGFLQGKKLIIPNMGHSIRIMDLLEDTLKRHGYGTVEAYPPGVEVIGMRKGEKLTEMLRWNHED